MIKSLLIISIICACIVTAYLIMLGYFTYGWLKLGEKSLRKLSDAKSGLPFLSIIIPFRNEEENLERITSSLLEQNYPLNKYEVILVDDHSEDKGLQFLSAINHSNIQPIRLTAGQAGKKMAISKGVETAKGDLIITLDADCSMGENWLSSYGETFISESPDLIIGPVCLQESKSFISSLQAVEFMVLQGVTMGAVGMGNPIMCNGANLGIKRETFIRIDGYEGIDKFPSGDDIMLLQKIKNHSEEFKVISLKNRFSIVSTPAETKWKGLINQRLRWASKTKFYKDLSLSFTAMITMLMNLSIVLTFALSFFNSIFIPLCIVLFIIKALIDLLFLNLTAPFFKKQNLIGYAIPLAIVYPFYVVLTGLIGPFKPVKWKGRKYNQVFSE